MTEAEWLAGADPIAMIEFRRGSPVGEDRVSWSNNRQQFHEPQRGLDRGFRLFACTCCRRIWDRIPEPCNRAAVVAVEGLSDGRVSGAEVEAAFQASSAVEYLGDGSRRGDPGYWAVKYLGRGFYKMTAGASALMVSARVLAMAGGDYDTELWRAFSGCYYVGGGFFLRPFEWPLPIPAGVEVERASQAALLRDIFGNPFRPVTPDPAWLTSTVVALAAGIYADRAFDRLPILADALQDAGCDHPDVLAHCRDPHLTHVRGCWVVDLLLGKS
jgi:hypothetical protein